MIRALALLLTVLTGFSGLVYEVVWQKALATLLGSHSEATAAVLGIFLGGLSLGYALFGRLTRALVARADAEGRAAPLLLVYGAVESAIGLWAFAFLWLFAGARSLSLLLPAGSEGPGFAVDVVLTMALIGPPTVCMGGTIPLLTQALANSLADATRVHALVYGFNTAGAFAGALAAAFVLIPRLGIGGSLWAMGAINLGAGIGFGLLGLRLRRAPEAAGAGAAARAGPSRGVAGLPLYDAVALLLGFSMMSIQTVLIRIGGLALGASHFTFATVVAVYVLCLALGGLVVSLLPRIAARALVVVAWTLAGLFLLLYFPLDDATYWAHWLRTRFGTDAGSFHAFHLGVFAALLGVLALPVCLSGATLPLLFHHLRRQVGDLGGIAGRLYSWNTVGSLLGALLGGYALLFWLDLDGVYALATASLVAAAGLLTLRIEGLSLRRAGAGIAVGIVLVYTLLPRWDPLRLSVGAFRSRQATPATAAGPAAFFASRARSVSVPFYDDDPTSSVAVRQAEGAARSLYERSIVNNGKPDGSVGGRDLEYPTMGLLGLMPCLFADACERAFVVGWGTGVTAGELAALDSTHEVQVAEISRGVLEAGPFFEHANQHASQSPKLRVVRSDAYRALLRSEGDWDVIVSEPSNPWVAGVEMLFSREFLQAAHDRLRPGGVYVQWFHAYETDTETLSLILRTYASVFEDVSVWFTYGPDMLILGLPGPRRDVDLARLALRVESREFAAGLARSRIQGLPELLIHELLPLGVVHATRLPGEIHTLLHPILSDRAARAFFRGQLAALPLTMTPEPASTGARSSLLRRWVRAGGQPDERVRAALAVQLCDSRPAECVTWLADWQRKRPVSPRRERVLKRLREFHQGAKAAEHFSPATLERVEQLLSGPAALPDSVSPEQAALLSRDFEIYYSHSVPFERATLAEAWRRCQGPAPSCENGRRRVEARIGPLASP